jgi:flotillin
MEAEMEGLARAGELETLITWVGTAFAIGAGILILFFIMKKFLYICRPNEVRIFSGRKRRLADGSSVGFRVVFGGRAWRIPIIERVDKMDMTTIPIEVSVTQAYSKGGIPLSVRAIANVKLSSDPHFINNSIERFLGKDRSEVHRVARETLEGTLRGVLATLTPEEVNENRLKFAASLAEDVEGDFEKLGLALDTLKVQHVTDEVQYLESIGRARIANVIKEAEIAESNAKNEANKRAADAKANGEVARKDAERAIIQKKNDQRRIAAEFEAQAESELRRAKAAGEQARAEAEQELQTIRRELEQLRLQADVVIPADTERQARELIAKGEAAPIQENGRALAQVLQMLAKAWADAGPAARDIFLIQQIEDLMATIVRKLNALKVKEVNIIDPGDGSALPNYVAGFPSTVTSILRSLRESTGVDIAELLSPNNGHTKERPTRRVGSSLTPPASPDARV